MDRFQWTFSRIASGGSVSDGTGSTVWQGDAAAGTKIRADRHDSHDQDLANGLSECLTRSGKGVPSVDIPWGGKKITNLQNPTPGSQDAATANYVDTMTGWTTHKDLTGTGVEGRLNFTGLTGVNGITWSTSMPPGSPARPMPTMRTSETASSSTTPSTPVTPISVTSCRSTSATGSSISRRLGHPPQPDLRPRRQCAHASRRHWRPVAAHGKRAAGVLQQPSDDRRLRHGRTGELVRDLLRRQRRRAIQQEGVRPDGAADRPDGGVARWIIELGSSNAEAADNSGSDFGIHGYNNAGGYAPGQVMSISRKTGQVSFPLGTVSLSNTGHVTTTGQYTSGQNFVSSTALAVLAATGAGQIALRPNGVASGTGQLVVGSAGDTTINGEATVAGAGNGVSGGIGYKTRTAGTGGANQGNRFNMAWPGRLHAPVGGHHRSRLDRRRLRLPAQEGRRRAALAVGQGQAAPPDQLHACRLGRSEQGRLYRALGLHRDELQETPIDSAANGHKDAENVIESPNRWTLIAALTATLQEAQVRIQALEAK